MASAPPGTLAEFAPAKVNLALHVTGRRADGYHLLDSLVVFPGIGDRVVAERSETLSLAVDGPFGRGLGAGTDNLVMRAALLLRPEGLGAALRLEKNLPVASGIGGGSADAAAALRVLARLWGVPLPRPEALLSLGADVPVCVLGRPCRMEGIGERLTPLALPPFWIVLVNPGVPLATPVVFAALERRDNAPMPAVPDVPDAETLFGFLAAQRNDLEPAAVALEPAIAMAVAALAARPGCRLARMSGSGATVFGLFAAEAHALAAAEALRHAHASWWIAAGLVAPKAA